MLHTEREFACKLFVFVLVIEVHIKSPTVSIGKSDVS